MTLTKKDVLDRIGVHHIQMARLIDENWPEPCPDPPTPPDPNEGGFMFGKSVKDFGAKGDGRTDDTAAIERAMQSSETTILFPAGRYLFGQMVVPARKQVLGEHVKSVFLLCTRKQGDAVIMEGNWSSLRGITVDAVSDRTRSGAGRGIVLDSGGNVTYQQRLNVIVQNQPGDGLYAVAPEECEIRCLSQNNQSRGVVVTFPNHKGISNEFYLRCKDNRRTQIDVTTKHSVFWTPEALVRGAEHPVQAPGTLFRLDGIGNIVYAPDIEVTKGPSNNEILDYTGLAVLGKNQTVTGGVSANCGTAVRIEGYANKVDRIKCNIYSGAASNPVPGSIGIDASKAREPIVVLGAGGNKIETMMKEK